jgi:hypothetical protein
MNVMDDLWEVFEGIVDIGDLPLVWLKVAVSGIQRLLVRIKCEQPPVRSDSFEQCLCMPAAANRTVNTWIPEARIKKLDRSL